MKKNFGNKNWMFPMPVLMIATCGHTYRIMGDVVANAFTAGKDLMK